MPSVSFPNAPAFEAAAPPAAPSVTALASPSPAPSLAAMTSYVVSTLDEYTQLLVVFQQEVSNDMQAIDREIAQFVPYVQLRLDNFLGINPNAQNSSPNTTASQPGNDIGMGRGNSSGSGSGSSASTTHNSPNQPLNNPTQQSGRGSGSSSTTTTHQYTPATKLHPMTSGTGTGTGTGTGSGFKPQVYFGSGSYSFLENGSGSGAELEVELSAPSMKTVTVNYQTSDGSATAGTDYTTEDKTLTFQPSVTSQYIQVPIIDDGPSDDNVASQSFTASLFGPNNATLRTPSTTNVSIMEQNTVSGQVWLDNNGDGSLNNGEMGYYGDSVNLYSVIDQNGDDPTLVATTTTTTNPYGNNFQIVVPASYLPGYFEIQVGIPQYFYATKQTGQSQINNAGFSPVFALSPGGTKNIQAGLRSMEVTTTDDDPNGPLSQDQDKVTLRDAIQTGNNGPPAPAVTFSSGATGTIPLEAALPDIAESYDIDGPGASTLTVAGLATAKYPFRIGIIDSGVTTTISGLTLKGGYDTTGEGGGVANYGNLTLNNDFIIYNYTTGDGGGVYNYLTAKLQLSGVYIANNNAGFNGGGLDNVGTVTNISSSQINNNNAQAGGGGINNGIGTITLNNSQINYNTAGTLGGGVANRATFIMHGGTISNNKSESGGGILNTTGKMTMDSGAKIENNQAQQGGGIFIESGGTLTLKGNSTVSGNTATAGNGGGIYITKATVTVSGGTIKNNSAGSNNSGGGIYNLSGSLTLKGGVTIGPKNTALDGGGMYLGRLSTTNFNSVTVGGNNAETGVGIYEQEGATMNPKQPKPPNLIDNDDSGGQPVQGP